MRTSRRLKSSFFGSLWCGRWIDRRFLNVQSFEKRCKARIHVEPQQPARFRSARAAASVLSVALTLPAFAANFTVNAPVDAPDANPGNGQCASAAGACTLRAAIQESNAQPGADVITLPAGTYNLTLTGAGEDSGATGDLDISDDLTINGGNIASATDTVISGGGSAGLRDRIIDVVGKPVIPISVRINGVTIQGGYQERGANGGGGICNHCTDTNVNGPSEVPSLVLNTVVVRDNFSFSTGAGISNHGTMMIDNSVIADNYTPYGSPAGGIVGQGGGMGGGLMNWGGSISILRTTISGNYAQTGGGIYNQDTFVSGIVLLTDSTVRDNVAAMGGGIYNLAIGDFNFPGRSQGQVGLSTNRTTISGNYAEIDGGGLYNLGIGTVAMINSTVSTNQTGGRGSFAVYPNRGGGIYHGGRLLDLLNVTLAGNESAGTRVSAGSSDGSRGGDELFLNIQNVGGGPGNDLPMVINLQNVIIGDGTGTDDNCNGASGYAARLSGGNNLDSGSTCGPVGASSVSSADPRLGPLASNGGLTQTMALFTGSSALNRGALCPSTDQRGMPRDSQCDVGAVELSGSGTPVPPQPEPPVTPPPPPVTPPPPPVNTAPVARNGDLSVAVGATATGALIAVDTETDPLTFRIVAASNQGRVLITNAATGAFSYTANAGATGTDSFTFVANDGRLDSNIATVSVTITAVAAPNRPPVATPGTLNVAPGATVSATLAASDMDEDALSFRVVRAPAQGNITLTNTATGAFSYTANANATGSDSFTFVANDGRADSNTAPVTITVTVPNAPPSAGDGVLSVAAGATVTGTLVGSDPNQGDILNFSVVTDVRKGMLAVTNPRTGAFSYTAGTNATGSDVFTFRVSDGKVDSGLGNVTINITNSNAPPSAGDGVLGAAAGTVVRGQLPGADPDGDTVTFSIVAQPRQGTVTLSDARLGTYEYRAFDSAVGQDSFTYSVTDGQANSNTGAVSITLGVTGAAPAGALPQVGDLSINVSAEGFASGQLAVASGSGALMFTVINNVSQGELTLNPSSGEFSYRADAGAQGVDTFTYRATNGTATSNTAVAKLVLTTPATVGGSNPALPGGGPASAITDSGAITRSGGGGVMGFLLLPLLAAAGLRRRNAPRTRRG